MIKSKLKYFLGFFYSIFHFIFFNRLFIKFASKYLHLSASSYVNKAWRLSLEEPEFFFHQCDLYQWTYTKNSQWLERGVWANLNIPPKAKILDLCCGDGFIDFYFLSERAEQVYALDYSDEALKYARAWHSSDNIKYINSDITKEEFPGKEYDAVLWNAFLDYFSKNQIDIILKKIHESLSADGNFIGYITKKGEKVSLSRDDIYTVNSTNEVKDLLSKYFALVSIKEITREKRTNYYFSCKKSSQPL